MIKVGYLSKRIQLEELGSFIRHTHLKIWGQLDLDASELGNNESLTSILVFGCMQDLHSIAEQATNLHSDQLTTVTRVG